MDKYPEVLLPLADVQVGPQTDLVAIVGGVEAFGIDEKVVIVPQFLMVVGKIIYPPYKLSVCMSIGEFLLVSPH